MKDVNLFATESDNGIITILKGKALDPKPPVKILLAGNIDTVKEFLKKRYRDKIDMEPGVNNGVVLQKIDPKSAIIIVDEEEMTIRLKLDPENAYGTEVTGALEFTKYLDQFHINQPVLHKREELVKLLRFSRQLFRDGDKYEELLKAYQTFDFKAYIEAAESRDTRGNKAGSMSKKVETNLPDSFILSLPIFKGQGNEQFRVDICFDTTDASIKFWFESTELAELIDKRKIEIFTEELLDFQDFVIIRK